MYSLSANELSGNTFTTLNTTDVSFSIPDWKTQEIKSISQKFEK